MYMPHPIPNKFEENVHIEQNDQKQNKIGTVNTRQQRKNSKIKPG